MVKIGDFVEILDGVYYPDTIKVQSSKLGHWPISNCQLILRPLSDITDAELSICTEICGFIGEAGRLYLRGLFVSGKIEDIDAYPNEALKMFDYLRIRNFCLHFCGLDPIQEGWAVLESDKNSTT
jgi:hypothetical protein